MAGLFSLLIGRTLRGRYKVERLIGKGGMGAVFLATDAELEREVAVKVISMEPQSPEEEANLRARFRREARAAARLQHPNVVAIHDVGSDDATGLDFIVMELLRGEDLQQRLRRDGPLAPAQVLEVLHGAACGLGAGHRHGLVHRDVKPANLFLEDASPGHAARVRVLDFGIAQVLENSAATVTRLTVYGGGPLSAAYAAPEQLRGIDTLTPACDVFALACTAAELLTGALPFDDAQRERMRRGEPVPPPPALAPGLPEAVDAVLRRALSPRPQDRYADGDAFAAALADATDSVRARRIRPATSFSVDDQHASAASLSVDDHDVSAASASDPTVAADADDRDDPDPPAQTSPHGDSGTIRRAAQPTSKVLVPGAMVAVLAIILLLAPRGDRVLSDAGTQSTGSDVAPAAPGNGRVITIRQVTTGDGVSGRFEPSTIHARPGDVLRFVADGNSAHNIEFTSADNPGVTLPAPSPYLSRPGDTYDLVVDLPPGSYTFHCAPHSTLGEGGTLLVS